MPELAPDGEKVVGRYLRSHASLVALGTRVVGKTPDSTSASWIRCTLLDMRRISRAQHLFSYMLQLDCYAGATGGQPEANSLALTVQAVLAEMEGAIDGTTVGAAPGLLGFARIPDTDFEPARERVTMTVEVFLHA